MIDAKRAGGRVLPVGRCAARRGRGSAADAVGGRGGPPVADERGGRPPPPPTPCAPLGKTTVDRRRSRAGESTRSRQPARRRTAAQPDAAAAAADPTDDCYRGGGAPYYHEIFVDPHRPDWIWSVNTNLERSNDGGKTWQHDRTREHRHARRSPRARVRSDRPQSHPPRQRRRPLRDLRRGQDVAVLREPADHAVLPRVGRQREAVLQRLRRHAGQLVVLRSVAHAEPPGASAPATGTSSAAATGSRRAAIRTIRPSSTRSRRTADISRARSAHRDLAQHPAARRSGGRQRRRRDAAARSRRSRRRAGGCRGRARAQVPAAQARQECRRGRRAGRAGSAGRTRRPVAAAARPTRANWDAPYIISPHNAAAALLGEPVRAIAATIAATTGRASARTCRATWIAYDIPIMGKVWPRDSVALQRRRRPRSATSSRSTSRRCSKADLGRHRRRPDPGDGGRRQELAEDRAVPGVPQWTYVTDVFASPRDANTVFVDAQQLAARRLQAVRREEHRPRARRGPTSPATCRTATTSGRSSRITSTATCCSPAPSSACSPAWTAASSWVQLQGRHAGRSRCATWRCRSARTISCSARSAAASTCSTTTARCARFTPQALAEEARLFPLRDAYLYNPLGHGAGRDPRASARCRATGPRRIRRLARCSPITWRRPPGRREAGADDHRRHRPADPPARSRQDARPAARRVEPRAAMPAAPTKAGSRRPGRRWRRWWRWRFWRRRGGQPGPARRRPDATARRSAAWPATTSRRSGQRSVRESFD